MSGFIARNQREIAEDRALVAYGVMLSFVQVVTFLWMRLIHLDRLLARGREAICWPFFENCGALRVLSDGQIRAVLYLHGGLGVASAVAFALRPRMAWWLLLSAELIKLAIVAQDFQLRMNQHYMAGFATLAFLFLPQKRRALRYLVVLFYFWAGTLKLGNEDWLSGAALYRPLWLFHGAGLRAACAYVVLLEVFLVWGLLAPSAPLFYGTLGQFVLFQVFSWPVVGFFYPLLMLAMLSIFPLARFFYERERPLLFKGEHLVTYGLLAEFSLLQLMPLTYLGDTAMTGEGRLFALHMFDARIDCHVDATLRDGLGGVVSRIDFKKPLPPRIMCDPIVYLSRARSLCHALPVVAPSAVDFDLHMESKHRTSTVYTPIVAIRGFCEAPPSYHLWKQNDWILRN